MTFIISAVLFLCSVTLTFAANAVERVFPKQQAGKSLKTSDQSEKSKLKQNNSLVTKAKRKASGDPHVARDPNVNRINR